MEDVVARLGADGSRSFSARLAPRRPRLSRGPLGLSKKSDAAKEERRA